MWESLTTAWEKFFTIAQAFHLIDIAEALLLTAALPIVFRTVRRVFLAGIYWLSQQYPLPAIQLRGLELVPSMQVRRLAESTLRLTYTLTQLWVVYLYISILFSVFAATQNAGHFLLSLVGNIAEQLWLSVVGYLPNVVSIGLIILISLYSLKFLKLLLNAIATESIIFDGFHKEWAPPTYKIIRFLLVMMVLIMIFPLLPGFDSPAFQGIGVFLGLLLSIGSSSAIANIVAGTVLIYTRSFDVGDRIETNGVVGDVVDKTLLVTRIETNNHEVVTIPNAKILNGPTINYTELADEGSGLILHTTVTIGYDVDWRKVHQVMIAAAQAITDVLTDPAPIVHQTSLDDFT